MLLILLSHSRRNRAEKSAKGIGFQSCIHSFIQCILIELNILRLYRALCISMQSESQISPLSHQDGDNAPSFLDLNLQIKDDLLPDFVRTNGTFQGLEKPPVWALPWGLPPTQEE